jgi:hypothetical protein
MGIGGGGMVAALPGGTLSTPARFVFLRFPTGSELHAPRDVAFPSIAHLEVNVSGHDNAVQHAEFGLLIRLKQSIAPAAAVPEKREQQH